MLPFLGGCLFYEIVSLNICHLIKNGNNFELHVIVSRFDVYTASSRIIVRPVSSWGKFCPVKILQDYLEVRLGLHTAYGND